uniref:Secreted protein n=3 Tax=Marmotini TaxID=337730 RepID=A0A8C9P918_SPEDA
MVLLGSSTSSRLRVKMWVMGKLVMTPLFFLMAPLGNSCPPPVYTVVDCRETLYLSPSFSTDFALFSLLTTKCNQ